MRYALLIVLVFVGNLQPAVAESYQGCDPQQAADIGDALRSAKDLTLKAAVAIGDTQDYQRWFGTYSAQNAEKVRANLKAIVSAMRGGGVTAQCERIADGGCQPGEYAWVYPNEPYLMHICPPFFTLPVLEALRPGTRRSDNGTREGTMVHEISHFMRVANTEDYCYSRPECAQMARTDARRAIGNADSYQYFTEDVTYYARLPLADKPPPAPRSDR